MNIFSLKIPNKLSQYYDGIVIMDGVILNDVLYEKMAEVLNVPLSYFSDSIFKRDSSLAEVPCLFYLNCDPAESIPVSWINFEDNSNFHKRKNGIYKQYNLKSVYILKK